MTGSVLFASALHLAVGGVLWLGSSLGEIQSARPVPDVIMIEMISEPAGKTARDQPPPPPPPAVKVETVELPEPPTLELLEPIEEFAPPISEAPVFEVPDFDIPEKKPAPPPTLTESPSAKMTLEVVITVPDPPQAQDNRQSNGQNRAQTVSLTVSPAVSPAVHPTGATQVMYAHNPKPAYPHEARRLRQEGVVVLNVDVSPSGRALAVVLKESSGHHLLDKAAQRAIRTWRFIPATRGGMPVRSVAEIPIRFFLSES